MCLRQTVFIAACAVSIGWAAAAAAQASAQHGAGHGPSAAMSLATPTLSTTRIAENVYLVGGDAANTGFIVGREGVIVIDTQRSVDAAKAQIAQIAKVTPQPVRTVIVTHGDPDHVGGLPAYSAGATIIAHENIRAQILATAAQPASASPFVGAYKTIAETRLPNRTIALTQSMEIDGVPVILLHVAPAHSAGDLIVFLPRQKTVFVGDLLTVKEATYPIIHVGGSSIGWIRMMKEMLALDADIFVAGHGALNTRAELTELLGKVEQRRDAIKAMIMQGKTLPEINAALPEEKISPAFLGFNETTYYELTRGYPEAQAPWVSLKPNDVRRYVASPVAPPVAPVP